MEQLTFDFSSDGETATKIGFEANHVANEFICGFDNFNLDISPASIEIAGDVYPDYKLNVVDIATLVSHFINKPSHFFTLSAADIDKDGQIDLDDLTTLANKVKGK